MKKKPSRQKKKSETELINTSKIKATIINQYGTITNYCKLHKLKIPEVSRFLNKKNPITLKALLKHAERLGLMIEVNIRKG